MTQNEGVSKLTEKFHRAGRGGQSEKAAGLLHQMLTDLPVATAIEAMLHLLSEDCEAVTRIRKVNENKRKDRQRL